MDKKIKCEHCSKEVLKTSLKKHYLSKYCMARQNLVANISSKDEEASAEIETIDENCYINNVPSDIMCYIIGYIQDFDRTGANIFGDLRLVCKNFNTEVIKYARLTLRKELLYSHKDIIYDEIPYFSEKEVLLYVLSINKYIGGTKAKDAYGVPQKTIKNLAKIRAKGGYILYNKDRIIVESLLLYKSYDNLEKELSIRKKRLDKRRENAEIRKKNEIAMRTKNLDLLLAKYGVVRRDDSNLCNWYINGQLCEQHWNIHRVVTRVVELNYLYNTLHMKHYIKIIEEEVGDNHLHDIDILEEAEQLALERIGGDYPDSIYKPIDQN